MRTVLIALAAAVIVASPAAATVNLVVNGGFETGDFTGWTRSNTQNATAINSNSPFEGSFDARLRTTTSGGNAGYRTLSQFITTNVGYSYQLSYALRNQGNPNPVDDFEVTAGNSFFDHGDTPRFGYTVFTQDFVATSASTLIEFRYLHPTDGNFQLDAVSVVAVPEPGTWAMLVTGFALVGATMRRRKAVAA